MKEFGYTITAKQRTIDYDQFNGRLLNEILLMEPSFKVCLSCGGCTATCSAGDLVNFNIRRMNLLLRRGETVELESEIQNACFVANVCWFAHEELTCVM